MFGSLCVSPYALSTPSGDLRLRQLAAGELRDVTLRAAEVESQDVAFLAHFIARCCKHLVRVRARSMRTGGMRAREHYRYRTHAGTQGAREEQY